MLNMATPISLNQLPSDKLAKLRRIGDFYVCNDFTDDRIWPKVIFIGENVYYRFMDFVYLPQPPESLSIDKVVEICDLRLELMDKLVDSDLNTRIVSKAALIASHTPKPLSQMYALDFGCGSGLSSILLREELPQLKLIGVDISKKAIESCVEKGLHVRLTYPDRPLPYPDATFDLIFAIFVMLFNVGIFTLSELKRVLQPAGTFVFNVYHRDIESIIAQLDEAGFGTTKVWEIEGVSVNHLIVSCGVS
jgi:SAM-dependent methyltransferase